jgi:adenylate cyclase
VERRLAAILAADVVGYSRLIRADEEGTLTSLSAIRKDLIDPKITEHHGRIVKLMGDGMLVEFASVVDAVHAAVETQQAVIDHNSDVPADKRIEFRIGINLGDVVIDGDDIQGDGVNVAARLEGLAEPGGICVSGMVYEGVRDRIDVPFEDLGEQEVKNIDRPVRVWRWLAGDRATQVEPFGATMPLPLPDKPSIAVLPFDNMSGDSEQKYFSDGITEDIITELSRFRSLFVIARNSSFHYKGQSPKIQEIGQELGVQYIVEGSVRKAANRVRVTAQLVEARSGNHLWAERYDRDLEDIFAVQDELVRTIVSTVGGRIDVVGKARAVRLNDTSLRAYDLYLRAGAAQDRNTREDYRLARQYLERAVALDPTLVQAHHSLSLVHYVEWMAHWVDDRDRAFANSMNAAKTAAVLDPADSSIHSQLGLLHMKRREFDESGQHFDKAIQLNPNDSRAQALYGFYLTAIGEPDQGIEQFDQAMRLNPLEPSWFHWLRGIAYFTSGRYRDAIVDLRSIKSPINEVRGWLAASYAQAGRLDEARAMLEEFLHIAKQEMAVFPGRKLSAWEAYWHGATEYKNEAHYEHLYDGLRRAGLAE